MVNSEAHQWSLVKKDTNYSLKGTKEGTSIDLPSSKIKQRECGELVAIPVEDPVLCRSQHPGDFLVEEAREL